MKIFLFLVSVLTFLLAMVHVLVATTSIHQIAGYILFLTSAVLMSGAGVVEAIHRLQKAVVPTTGTAADPHRYPPS